MKFLRTFGPAGTIVVISLLVGACGGGAEAAVEPEPTAPPAPTATDIPEPTETPQPPTPEPTATSAPTATAAPTATPAPTSTPIPPTAEPTEVPTAVPTEEPAEEPTQVPAAETTGEDPAAEPTAEPTAEQDPVVPVALDGAALFSTNCAFCHGPSGGGTGRGPTLAGIGQFFVSDASPLIGLVTNGGENMPEFGSKLTTDDINAVVQYVVETFQ